MIFFYFKRQVDRFLRELNWELRTLNRKLETAIGQQHTLNTERERKMPLFDTLIATVSEISGTVDSTVTFINDLTAKLDAALALTDPEAVAKIEQINADLKSQKTKLANAIDNDPNT